MEKVSPSRGRGLIPFYDLLGYMLPPRVRPDRSQVSGFLEVFDVGEVAMGLHL